ncbi:acyl-CoA thioesterase [Marinobacterium nitratireducens]|uniref:Acyl-CoA thioesterase n=1 Tax=Marinobacterium nitratireducens TaxID=518897 RepID=A0A917Z7G7_9GAMM|nr:hotdog domain-containing protein [Marinobacterium nitratireducens]GGO77221.1 acyl-CoA thioesterase [Marinobacterium nitratireducens]
MPKAEDQLLVPEGELSLKLPASSEATNMFGDVYGGWVAARAVEAAEIRAATIAEGRIATVSVGSMDFMAPVLVGTILSFFTRIVEQGRSSMRIAVEVWGRCPDGRDPRKVSEVECVQVAIDEQGRIRRLPQQDD